MKAFVADLELLACPTVIVPVSGSAKVVLDESQPNLFFEFQFREAPGDLKPSMASEAVNNTTLRITFTNFKNPLGICNAPNMRIGSFKNRELFFNYHIAFFNDQVGYKCQFFYFLGKEVAS
jgi:hypothetical protein